jgi:internalin A
MISFVGIVFHRTISGLFSVCLLSSWLFVSCGDGDNQETENGYKTDPPSDNGNGKGNTPDSKPDAGVASDTDTLISALCEGPVVFPDERLEQEVRTAIDKPTGDIFATDLGLITELNLERMSISNLTGIQCMSNLSNLDISHTTVQDISPLFGATGLTELRMSYLPVGEIDTVSMSYHDLNIDLTPIADLFNLTLLAASYNAINDISPLSGLTNLSFLSLSTTDLSDITPLVENPGIDKDDLVFITNNPNLDCEDATTHDNITTLENRGVDLRHNCGQKFPELYD